MMNDYETCKICGDPHWIAGPHKDACKPLYRVRCNDWHDDDESDDVRANSHKAAAERWAEDSDNNDGDYDIVNGIEVTLTVTGPDGSVKVFKVTGESVPEYTARRDSAENQGLRSRNVEISRASIRYRFGRVEKSHSYKRRHQ